MAHQQFEIVLHTYRQVDISAMVACWLVPQWEHNGSSLIVQHEQYDVAYIQGQKQMT